MEVPVVGEERRNCNSAVEILRSFVRHRSDRIRDFVRPNKILSDRTFFRKAYNFGHLRSKYIHVLFKEKWTK